MRSIEVSGKSVDEAIFNGLDQLNLSIDQVDIEIIDGGGKRLFGMGNKNCVVRLTEREEKHKEDIPAKDEPPIRNTISIERRPPRTDAPRERRQRPEYGERKGERQNGRSERSGARTYERAGERAKPRYWGEPYEGGPEVDFLRGVLSRMGIEANVDGFVDESCVYLRLSGESMGVLIGRRGETLNSLQYLCNLVANHNQSDYKRVVVDTENYRIKREETLKRLAKRMAENARRSGKPIELEPMNPYERRVLHYTLQNDPYVTTHSEGEEPERHVVITLK